MRKTIYMNTSRSDATSRSDPKTAAQDIFKYIKGNQDADIQIQYIRSLGLVRKKSDEVIVEQKEDKEPLNLNGTQQDVIEVMLNPEFADIAKLNSNDAINALKISINIEKEITEEESKTLKQQGVLDNVERIRSILSHPQPQNRYQGNAGAYFRFIKNRDLTTEEKKEEDNIRENGVYKGKVYFYEKKSLEAFAEPQGLLGLTALKHSTTASVTKEAVVTYIHKLVNREIVVHQEASLPNNFDPTQVYEFLSLEIKDIDNQDCLTPIHWIAKKSDPEVLIAFLDKLVLAEQDEKDHSPPRPFDEIINLKDANGNTFLHLILSRYKNLVPPPLLDKIFPLISESNQVAKDILAEALFRNAVHDIRTAPNDQTRIARTNALKPEMLLKFINLRINSDTPSIVHAFVPHCSSLHPQFFEAFLDKLVATNKILVEKNEISGQNRPKGLLDELTNVDNQNGRSFFSEHSLLLICNLCLHGIPVNRQTDAINKIFSLISDAVFSKALLEKNASNFGKFLSIIWKDNFPASSRQALFQVLINKADPNTLGQGLIAKDKFGSRLSDLFVSYLSDDSEAESKLKALMTRIGPVALNKLLREMGWRADVGKNRWNETGFSYAVSWLPLSCITMLIETADPFLVTDLYRPYSALSYFALHRKAGGPLGAHYARTYAKRKASEKLVDDILFFIKNPAKAVQEQPTAFVEFVEKRSGGIFDNRWVDVIEKAIESCKGSKSMPEIRNRLQTTLDRLKMRYGNVFHQLFATHKYKNPEYLWQTLKYYSSISNPGNFNAQDNRFIGEFLTSKLLLLNIMTECNARELAKEDYYNRFIQGLRHLKAAAEQDLKAEVKEDLNADIVLIGHMGLDEKQDKKKIDEFFAAKIKELEDTSQMGWTNLSNSFKDKTIENFEPKSNAITELAMLKIRCQKEEPGSVAQKVLLGQMSALLKDEIEKPRIFIGKLFIFTLLPSSYLTWLKKTKILVDKIYNPIPSQQAKDKNLGAQIAERKTPQAR